MKESWRDTEPGQNSAFIFDMDGTLVDSMRYHILAWRELTRGYGITLTDAEIIQKISGTVEEGIKRILGTKLDGVEIEQVCAHKEEIYRRICQPHLEAIAGAERFLHCSRNLGVYLGLGTSAGKLNVDFTLAGLSFETLFDAVVGGDDVARGKPDPETFLRISEKSGIAPHRCVVFEDSVAGVQAARRAGMKVIFVNYHRKPVPPLIATELSTEIRDYVTLEPEKVLTYLTIDRPISPL